MSETKLPAERMPDEAGNSLILQFVSFQSRVDPSFWYKLGELKLKEYKLDDSPKIICATYSNCNAFGIPCAANLDSQSFNRVTTEGPRSLTLNGSLYVYNTLSDFKSVDKNQILRQNGHKIFELIRTGEALHAPSATCTFVLLTYLDLKKFHLYYWFAFPCLSYPTNIKLDGSGPQLLISFFDDKQLACLRKLYFLDSNIFNCAAFLLESIDSQDACLRIHKFSVVKDLSIQDEKLYLCFCDPSVDPQRPGWPLRNILALWAYYRPTCSKVKIVCWRTRYDNGRLEFGHSLILHVHYSLPEQFNFDSLNVYGWEKNQRGELMPHFINLSNTLKPERLAAKAVTLNLELMRWRLVPELNLDELFQTSCLLFGAGTLGCNVARCLLAWGVNKITLIDNSTVSYSNPVRQSLYGFSDCLASDQNKATVAALSLKRIFPNIDAQGFNISVPMPGHPVSASEEEQLQSDVTLIENLVKSHDVIFVLLDSREARWLPSTLGCLHKKLIISAALGFDSFLVMRHGVRCDFSLPLPAVCPQYVEGANLGCYFCCDVTAPGDSLSDRTLDQQCTVSRPGASFLAAGLAVELMITTLQHPLKSSAPASCIRRNDVLSEATDDAIAETCLGSVPHQIRGFLSRFEQMTPTVQSFSKCVCCSRHVMSALEDDRQKMHFLKSVFNDSSFLERLSGLDELRKEAESAVVLEWSDDDSIKSS